MRFSKYHALGNDYLVCDAAHWPQGLTASQVVRLCDRHHGIGADGVLWGPLPAADAQFGLRIYNPDGGEAQKSGNGLRIFCRYLHDRGLIGESAFRVWTRGGIVGALVTQRGESICVDMGRVSFDSREIPVAGPAREVIEESMTIGGTELRYSCASIGNPHCVIAWPQAGPEDARRIGPLVERDVRFPERINVQLLEIIDRANIRIEIWERGAGYTLASGSSSAAATAVAYRLGLVGSDVSVHMPGGSLQVRVGEDFSVRLEGPVTMVAEGVVDPEAFKYALPRWMDS